LKKACRLSQCNLVPLLALALGCSLPIMAQITSSPNVVGSGARALGMGGAFIAIADDATAASWNPGGLTQLERPELSLVYNGNWFGEDFSSGTHPELDGSYNVGFDQLNYFSFVYPIPKTLGGRNMVLSLNYQRKYDFDRDLNLDFFAAPTFQKITYRQRGSLGSLSPAFGIEITDRLSVGVVWNIWDSSIVSDNEWKERVETRVSNPILGVFTRYTDLDYDDIKGSNFTLGVLYRPSERWTLGAVYNTKFTASMNFTSTVSIPLFGAYARTRRQIEYVFPSSLGIGAAYRFPNDKLTLSLDVTRREWDQFVIHDPKNPTLSAQRRSAVTQISKQWSPHKPTYTVRFGGEYVFVKEKAPKQDYLPSLRGGVFYDPEPAGGRSDSWFGLGKGDGAVEDYYGITLGLGLLVKNRVNLDLAYVYRWGRDVRKDTFGQFGFTNTDARVDQHTLYLSTVIYF
jgi:long-subunit fatty acid transport protein